MASQPAFRVYTVTLPPDLAQKAEELARRDSRSIDELFSDALSAYYAQDIRKTCSESENMPRAAIPVIQKATSRA